MRAFFKTGSTITEFTKEIAGYKSGNYDLTYVAGDAIYLAAELPFNHFYIKLGTTVNALSSDMTISNYRSSAFTSAVNLVDQTSGLFASGFVDFTVDRQAGWDLSNTNSDGSVITELSTITVYDMYWAKITFNNTLTASIDLNWIGNKFSDDYDLFSEHPNLNDTDVLTAFESGKTNWEEQAVRAAEIIIKDLQTKKIIFRKEQVLDREVFKLASISKTAQIIYTAFGKDYVEKAIMMKNEYESRIKIAFNRVDTSGDGSLSIPEKFNSTGWLSR
jgi:hypothetical protein